MFKVKNNNIYASEIAEFLNNKLHGEDFLVNGPCSLKSPKSSSFTYTQNSENLLQNALAAIRPFLIICPVNPMNEIFTFATIHSKNPKLDFINIVREFFVDEVSHSIHSRAIIEKGANIGENVAIGANSIIEGDVEIKDNTIIGRNVVISGEVTIGKNCVIKDNATIGSEGYCFEFDENGIPIHFPPMGRIIIGNYVWIGSSSTIELPPTEETIIQDHVKIDDLVQIGHNCIIGEKSQITAGVILCSRVKVGKKCWLSPNVSVKDDISIGDGALVGMGGVVINDLPSNIVVAGNPVHQLKNKKHT